jgi:hypothetical protein
MRERGRFEGSPEGSAKGMNRDEEGGELRPEIARSSSVAVECSTKEAELVLPIEGRRSSEGVERNASRSGSGRR